MASLKIQFFTRHREAGTQAASPSALDLAAFSCCITPEKIRGGNCISGNMSPPRNACTSVCPDRSRCCFNCAIPGLARAPVLVIGRRDRRAAASPRMSRTRHFCTVRIDTTFVGFPATSPLTCAAQRSNAARRSGSSSLLL